jgi:uroporphyrinogen-III synthase
MPEAVSGLTGRTIALAEGRELEQLASMLEREGANAIRCPIFSIRDVPNQGPVVDWIRALIAGTFDFVVFFTGEGVRRLVASAEHAGIESEFIAGLARCRLVTRGPKPVKALREIDLAPSLIAETPTMDGVIATLQKLDLKGTSFGIQLYPDAHSKLSEYLESVGAKVRSIVPYVYAPKSDREQVAALIRRMAAGEIDAIVFTSSPQVDRLEEMAKELGLKEKLKSGWSKTKAAAIGPIVAENLRQRGVQVDICPEQGFVMKNLVRHIERGLNPKNA